MGVPGIKQRPETVLRCKIKGYTQKDIYAGYPGHLYFRVPLTGGYLVKGVDIRFTCCLFFALPSCGDHLWISRQKGLWRRITGGLTVSVWLQLVKSWVFDQIGEFYLEQWSSTIKLGDSSLAQHYINSEQFLEPVLIHSKGEADSNDTLLQSLAASLPCNFLVSPLNRWAVKYGW